MRILLLGHGGQVGWECRRTLAPLGEVVTADYPEVDFAQPEGLPALMERVRPQVIVNAAAYTAVDRAESEPETARRVNALAPGVLAQSARRLRAALVHISTDYVFDGRKGAPYTEEDIPNPLSVYGQTKWEGEQAVQEAGGAYLILRTSWVYSLRRESFVSKVLEWSRQKDVLRVVDDQVAGPTWARMLAQAISAVLAQSLASGDIFDWLEERRGVYHLAGKGWCSRYQWACEILRLDPHREQQRAREILPARTAEFSTPAVRPLFSALEMGKFERTFGLTLPLWSQALEMAMEGERA